MAMLVYRRENQVRENWILVHELSCHTLCRIQLRNGAGYGWKQCVGQTKKTSEVHLREFDIIFKRLLDIILILD